MIKFPRGLRQPAGSARFGQDSLLLASFAAKKTEEFYRRKKLLALEIGCGCGAALLGFSLLRPESLCVGIEREAPLAESARENAILCGRAENCSFFQADLANLPADLKSFEGKAQILLANPPWRKPGQGKITSFPLRQTAYWEITGTLELFLRMAVFFLAHHGRLFMILPVWQLHRLMTALQGISLGLRLIQPVSAYYDSDIRRVLIICQKNAATDYLMRPPLILHEKSSGKKIFTSAAKAFCPWLE